ncbi:helix-turn-helix domain-containing protein [Endozoicomonas ascidiicola]|uniref:helix-turn-helix domain-containing protein n=1 Tax=Endozoicomonas ascidiicola TaxID=1698521 RepID=UPI00082C155C|nr:helix-turn-helix transcriptional regulator [Endozoicomonas ascidiicola]
MSDRSSEALSPLPKRLMEARRAKGLSQKKLGILAGIDEFSASSRMNQYEKGKHAPDFATLKRLSDELDMPTCYFYCEEDWLAEILIRVQLVSASHRRKILQLLNLEK